MGLNVVRKCAVLDFEVEDDAYFLGFLLSHLIFYEHNTHKVSRHFLDILMHTEQFVQ